MNITHRPVLLAEAVTALISGPRITSSEASKNLLLIDGTFGRGGHTQALLSQLPPSARMISFDKDLDAIAVAEKINDPRLRIVHDSFAQMDQYAEPESVDGILLDLGISSPQIDEAIRGFSFRMDGPLDMRMDNTRGESAAAWLAHASEKDIARVIKEYGEERFAVQIAKAIVASREQGIVLGTTRQLASLVAGVVRTREPGQDPATRTFQAIRIYINQELADVEAGLMAAMNLLKPGGRLAVISFHSLEDRMVKQFMQSHSKVNTPRGLPLRESELPMPELKLIGRIKPSASEIEQNPRSRSAILRVAQKNNRSVN